MFRFCLLGFIQDNHCLRLNFSTGVRPGKAGKAGMSETQATVSSRPGPSRKVVVQEETFRVTEMILQPGGEVRTHRHTWMTDVFYGLAGELLLEVEGRETIRLVCGAGAEVRPGLLHGARNVGADEGRFLLVQHGGRYDFLEPSQDTKE